MTTLFSTASTTWPAGPSTPLTGWHLLRHMSQDLLGSLRQWQQDYGDEVHLRIWPEHEIVLFDPALVRELLVTHHDSLIRWERAIQVFSQAQGVNVLTTEGAAWQQKRQTLRPHFSTQSIQTYAGAITEVTRQALSSWPSQTNDQPIDSAMTSLTMNVMMQLIFTCQLSQQEALTVEQAIHTLLEVGMAEMYWPSQSPNWMPWKWPKRRALRTLDQLIEQQIAQRLALPHTQWPTDMLSSLLGQHQQDKKNWPLQAVRDECKSIFLAGHETTAATLIWWMACMASHPDWQARVRAECQALPQDSLSQPISLQALPLLRQTIQETLRLYPAAPLLFSRRSQSPIQLGQRTYPARTLFLIPVMLIQRDARWFNEPLRFDPTRFADNAPEFPRGAYLPFGAGPRVCIGQHLAMMEMMGIASQLLQRFQWLPAAGQAESVPTLHISLRPAQALRLQWQSID